MVSKYAKNLNGNFIAGLKTADQKELKNYRGNVLKTQ